jgi:MFS family permease
MALLRTLGRTVGTGVKAVRLLLRGSLRGGVWATRQVGSARARGAANEVGMVRLFDLHAVSCAGDTLIAIGLAGTIFFNVPLGEARSKVALYLLVTMVPFALLAPVIGPLLDHFRHGRRYALATTMLGRAFLAWLISDNLYGFGLYPAVFGVLALSRAYGVARSAAVPRLLPEGVGLSQVGARASVYGTFAGAVVAPIGLAAFWFGPQWSLRVASVIFLVGMVISLRLPPRADSDPPEAVPRPFRAMLRLRRGPDRPLSGRLVIATLIGSATFRCLYGFLLLYFAFAVKAGELDTHLFGRDLGNQAGVAVVGGALTIGTFLSTAVGTRLRIRRPTALQSSGLTITAGVGVLATIFYGLPMVALLAFVTSIFSGISKLAVDASIQERVPERLRASAFAHSETVLMIAWVLGGGVGIIPLSGRLGVALAALVAVAAAIRAAIVAARLRAERLHGRPVGTAADPAPVPVSPAPGAATPPGGPPAPGAATPPGGPPAPGAATPPGGSPAPDAAAATGFTAPTHPRVTPPTVPAPGTVPAQHTPASPGTKSRRSGWRRSKQRATADAGPPATPAAGPPATPAAGPPAAPASSAAPVLEPDPAAAPPGFHVYRPSSAAPANGPDGGPGNS